MTTAATAAASDTRRPANLTRVAIIAAGNCASSLVQGVECYRDATAESRVPGLMHVQFGNYHVSDCNSWPR